MTYKIKKSKQEKEKYYVTFVPHYDKVGDWAGRRLTAYREIKGKSKDEFTIKEAEKVVEFLEKRGDKAIKINKLKE